MKNVLTIEFSVAAQACQFKIKVSRVTENFKGPRKDFAERLFAAILLNDVYSAEVITKSRASTEAIRSRQRHLPSVLRSRSARSWRALPANCQMALGLQCGRKGRQKRMGREWQMLTQCRFRIKAFVPLLCRRFTCFKKSLGMMLPVLRTVDTLNRKVELHVKIRVSRVFTWNNPNYYTSESELERLRNSLPLSRHTVLEQ